MPGSSADRLLAPAFCLHLHTVDGVGVGLFYKGIGSTLEYTFLIVSSSNDPTSRCHHLGDQILTYEGYTRSHQQMSFLCKAYHCYEVRAQLFVMGTLCDYSHMEESVGRK
jgi:hypothetical protein